MKNQENGTIMIPYETKYEEVLTQIYQDVYRAEPYREVFSEDAIKKVISRTLMYLLIDENKEVVGFVGGMPLSEFYDRLPDEASKLKSKAGIEDTPDSYYIAELAISPTKQRKGLGSELFRKFLSMLESEGYKSFVLCTADKNNKAQRLYENLNFQKCRDEKENIIYRKVTQLRTSGREETDERPYYIRSS